MILIKFVRKSIKLKLRVFKNVLIFIMAKHKKKKISNKIHNIIKLILEQNINKTRKSSIRNKKKQSIISMPKNCVYHHFAPLPTYILK